MFKTLPNMRPAVLAGIAMLILAGGLYGGLFAMARDGDLRQKDVEQAVISSALSHLRQKLADTLTQNAYWDEAYDHVSAQPDRVWTDEHFGKYSMQTAGIPITAIYASPARPIYTYGADELKHSRFSAGDRASLNAMIAKAQVAVGRPPPSTTAFVKLGPRLYIGAAQRIIPNDARRYGPLQRRFVLLYLVPLDRNGLAKLQADFRVASLGWAGAPPANRAAVAARDANGRTISNLTWRAATPGTAFAQQAAPFALLCFALVAALQFFVVRHWLDAARRLRDESQTRTMFLANASHELRTPLNAIIGFSEVLATEMFGPLSVRYKAYASDIHDSGKHLLSLVNDVLDLTHYMSDKEIEVEAIVVADALTGPLRMLREYAKPERITVTFNDASRGATVRASQKSLSQIALNLGSNAVKFSPAGATVELSLAVDAQSKQLILELRDHGAGIPAEKMRFIGQPFLQAHQTREGKPGTGLGLAIVKSLAEKLGGELIIRSQVNVGTTAIVRLPICTVPSQQRQAA